MFKIFKQATKAAVIAMVLSVSTLSIAAQPVYAANSAGKAAACTGIGLTGPSCTSQDATKGIGNLMQTVVKLLSFIVGAVAVIMIIIAGFKYVTSGGDSNSVASAKNTLIYAIIGLVVVALAQFIVRVVFGQVV